MLVGKIEFGNRDQINDLKQERILNQEREEEHQQMVIFAENIEEPYSVEGKLTQYMVSVICYKKAKTIIHATNIKNAKKSGLLIAKRLTKDSQENVVITNIIELKEFKQCTQ